MRKDGKITIESFETDQNVHVSVKAPLQHEIKDPEHIFIPFGEETGKEISVPICFRIIRGMGGQLSLMQQGESVVFAASLLKAVQQQKFDNTY
jgi:hypothetical protein